MRSCVFDEYFSFLRGKIQILSSLEEFQCCLKTTHCLNKTAVWSGTALGSAGAAPPWGSGDDMSAGMGEAQCA